MVNIPASIRRRQRELREREEARKEQAKQKKLLDQAYKALGRKREGLPSHEQELRLLEDFLNALLKLKDEMQEKYGDISPDAVRAVEVEIRYTVKEIARRRIDTLDPKSIL